MISDLGYVVKSTINELVTGEGISEVRQFLNDSISQLFLGELLIDHKHGYILDDPHVHYPKPRNTDELASLVRAMSNRLDRSSITTWSTKTDGTEEVNSILRYEDLSEVINSLDSDIKGRNLGPITKIYERDQQLLVYPSTEIRTRSPLPNYFPHITAEGCLEPIPSGLDARKTIELIHKQGGIANIEHNATRTHPVFQYILTNPQEDAFTRELFDMADATEVFNSYNTLWMVGSNSKAKRDAKNYDIAKIAGTDLHFGTASDWVRKLHKKRIGKAGIWLPNDDIEGLTGKEIIAKKRNNLKTGNYVRLESYTDPLTFFMTMMPPIIYRNLTNLLNKIGVKSNFPTDSIS